MPQNELSLDQLKQKLKCCVSEKPLSTSPHLNAIQLPYKVTWEFPKWGNFITKQDDMALAFVHDDHMNPEGVSNIKWAVEVRDGEIVYHELSSLQKVEIKRPVNPKLN